VVRAHNFAGDTDSLPLVLTLAAVPDTPVDQVTSDANVTSDSLIKVKYGPLTSSQNGGAPILSYELQMDDGRGGNYSALIGADD
jgi:hypothetical protein